MIKVENLSYSLQEKNLYDKISFSIEADQHCALIGTSGTGKSTLVDLLRQPNEYLYDGKVIYSSDCRMGYVSQFSQMDQTETKTVFEYLSEEFVRLEQKLAHICSQMETATDFEVLMEQYQEALDQSAAIDGDNYESNITKQLNTANLGSHKDRMLGELSGGEFKLVQVIKEMLLVPNILIMDEPDVYLDFEHLNGLKDLINSYSGAVLVVTHNRYLLNHCFNKILHLENKELQEFNGRYVDYQFSLLQMKIELMEVSKAEQEEIDRNQKIVEKLRADATYYTCASRGRALHARVSLLERLEARKIKAPFVTIKQPIIRFEDIEEHVEETAIKVEDYTASYDEFLLEHASFEIKSTEKVALIGANGTGKTTLLRDIYKNEKNTIQRNSTITTAFLSQLQGEMLNESNTIQEEFLNAGYKTYEEVEEYLSDYGFKAEEMDKKIGTLSGGEKNLLQIAKIASLKAGLLLLDEPTSHLDLYAQLALEKAIAEYKGAILMVSHDFYTIANCMDYVLLIEDKKLRRMSIRAFRKMIYANHFDKDYLELEQKKKTMEIRIAKALEGMDYERAKGLMEELEQINKKL